MKALIAALALLVLSPHAGGAAEETAIFAGGCFWGMQEILRGIDGVLETRVGYCGGNLPNATYEDVSRGDTGHAESVEIVFDPARISFKQLLTGWFFRMHDPTTLNRQGNDEGTQYRSAIYYHSPAQQTAAEAAKTAAQAIWEAPIVTEITAFDKFFKAEGYHQNYYKDNPNQPYCSIIIAPKVKKFREKWAHKLK